MTTKPKYDSNLHHRRSIRLKGYDYSSPGFYFITICLQNRAHMFGKVENGIMILNPAGNMVDRWYRKLPSKFPDIQCREYAIMPNHFHCIIQNTSTKPRTPTNNVENVDKPVGSTPSVENTPNGPDMGKNVEPIGHLDTNVGPWGEHMGSPLSVPSIHGAYSINPITTPAGFDFGQFDHHIGVFGEHKGTPLSAVIQWFKTMSTNEYIRNVKTTDWPPFDRKLWQRNYYEHIVRSDDELNRIQYYIINNPIVWNRDPEYQLKKPVGAGTDTRFCPCYLPPHIYPANLGASPPRFAKSP